MDKNSINDTLRKNVALLSKQTEREVGMMPATEAPLPSVEQVKRMVTLVKSIIFPDYFNKRQSDEAIRSYYIGVYMEELVKLLTKQIAHGLQFCENCDETNYPGMSETIVWHESQVFKLPDAYIPDSVATIPGTDGQKMSKSYHNTIELFDPSVKKKIMGIVTDSTPMEEPKEPDGNSVYEMYKLFATPEEVAEMAANFRAGGYGYGHAKKALLAAYKRMFDPFKARRDELEKDPDALEDILREGAKKARAAAAPVMEKVRRAVGL